MGVQAEPVRTLHQIVGVDGKAMQATLTEPVWVTTPGVFSMPTGGNKIKPLTSGKKYFVELMAALDAAQSEVLIAGWQVNWDALMAEGVRLYDVIYRNARRGIRFYVLPWNDANPVQTYETQTVIVLNSINERLKDEGVSGAGKVSTLAADTQSDRNAAYFSHHQKQVVIDGKTAFVGGIDLAYGRFDDDTYDLFSKAEGRWFLNSYNPGMPVIKKLKDKNMADPDLMVGAWDRTGGGRAEQMRRIKAGAFQVPYAENSPLQNNEAVEGDDPLLAVLSEAQPRQPWQDVHCRIDGPAAVNLARNFVGRWNSLVGTSERLTMPAVPPAGDMKAGCNIQVLRSAPQALRAAEAKASQAKTPTGVEDHIHQAMVQLIAKAKRFIYIESQFFVSAFGQAQLVDPDRLSPAATFVKEGKAGITDSKLWGMRRWADGGSAELDASPTNGVCAALVARIRRAILDIDRPKFHVYITLPVHPEGSLLSGAVVAQIHWTMQSLSFGSQSLLTGIRRAIKARDLRDAGDATWQQALADADTRYADVEVSECFEYVTLLNLRNWKKLESGRYITEQVYVHTKLLIVDDLYALLGSANINDRSLLGARDSELAVLVVDKASRADINGEGSNQPVRVFAHELRKAVWRKIFGIEGGERPATELAQAVDHPGIPDSWRLIQRRAQANAELYEAAFPWVPRNDAEQGAEGRRPKAASVLPTWNGTSLVSPMPNQEAFWAQARHTEAAAKLEQVKGYITALPYRWTEGENNRIPYPSALLVRNDPAKRPVPSGASGESSLALADGAPVPRSGSTV